MQWRKVIAESPVLSTLIASLQTAVAQTSRDENPFVSLDGTPTETSTLPSVPEAVEYDRLIRANRSTAPLDDGLFGESIDYFTGQTDFVAIDLDLPNGNGIPVRIGRRYHVQNHAGGVVLGAFGDWDFELPARRGSSRNRSWLDRTSLYPRRTLYLFWRSPDRLYTNTDNLGYFTKNVYAANAIHFYDRKNQETTVTYLQYDKPTTQWPLTIETPAGLSAKTYATRDIWGKIKKISRAGVDRVYDYDGAQQLKTIDEPETGLRTYTYWPFGAIKTIDHDGQVTETRQYDVRNRLTSITYNDGSPAFEYTWRPDGQPDTEQHDGVTRSFAYYDRGQLQQDNRPTQPMISIATLTPSITHISSWIQAGKRWHAAKRSDGA